MGGAGGLTVALLSWLPYRVAVAPSVSASYVFGYNNRVALGVVGAFALVVALVAGRGADLVAGSGEDEALPRKLLRRALWCATLLALPLHLIVRRTGGYIESPYFLDRIKLVLDGRVPYRDFEYAYGVFFVYVPAWIARGLHLSAADAYGILWFAVTLAGIWLLYLTVQGIPAPAAAKRGVFGFLFGMSVLGLLCTGVNYSTFRFILSPFFALFLYRRFEGARSAGEQASSIVMVAPCFLALLLVSPEMALSFGLGMVCYVAVFVDLRPAANRISYAGLLLLLGLMAWVGSRHGAFLTLNGFRSGGLNFPVMPAAPILLLLAMVALSSAYAGMCMRARRGSPATAVIFVSAAALASALGRCDGGHVLLGPLGLWIVGLTLAGRLRPVAGRLMLWSCILVFFLVPLTLGVRGVFAAPARAALLTVFAVEREHPAITLSSRLMWIATRLYGVEKAAIKVDEARRFAALHDGMDVASIYGYPAGTIFQAPSGFMPEEFGPLHTPQVETGYFDGWVNLVTPEQVQRKIAELARNPGRPLLLPEGTESLCVVSPEGERAVIRTLFVYPYAARAQHTGSVLEPFCVYLHAEYVLRKPATADRLGYAVWERR